jgi:hypothetical protein
MSGFAMSEPTFKPLAVKWYNYFTANCSDEIGFEHRTRTAVPANDLNWGLRRVNSF